MKVGTKLKIYSYKYEKEIIVTITYIRSGVIFFKLPNGKEDWLPKGSHIIQKAVIIKL